MPGGSVARPAFKVTFVTLKGVDRESWVNPKRSRMPPLARYLCAPFDSLRTGLAVRLFLSFASVASVAV